MPARALSLFLWLMATVAAAQDMPAPIETARQENAAACREAGGNPVETDAYILQRDLNGDTQPDFVVNLMGLTCEGAYSYFCGSAGCPVTVWTSGAQGWSVAWNNYAQDIAFEGDVMIAYLHGQFCTPPRTGADGCEERVSFAASDPAAATTESSAPQPDPKEAPAPDRWQTSDAGGMSVAVIGGTGTLRSLAAFCLQDQPWLALVMSPPPASDDIRVDFTFSSGTIFGPAQRQPTTGGTFVIGLAENPLPRLLSGRDGQVSVAIDGSKPETISLSGSTKALRTALGPCLSF